MAMDTYDNERDYVQALESRSGLPDGFRCSTVPLTFFPAEKPSEKPYEMNLALILLDEPSPLFGGLYTRNAFPGFPVILGREMLGRAQIRGVLINNRIANVGPQGGREDAERLLDCLGQKIGGEGEDFLPSSTGIIGWKLPVDDMMRALDPLVAGLNAESLLPVARAIMTTDRFAKVRGRSVGEGRVVALGKGAGMIEPNMATMLVFVLTDLCMPRGVLRRELKDCVEKTFNRISIDGDQSTSDTVLLMSSGRKPAVSEPEFREALCDVCGKLAEDIVRNGEGTHHVMRVTVGGELPPPVALGAAKALVNSPLVKTAVFGNDPNVGRLVAALGDYLGNQGVSVSPASVSIELGKTPVCRRGAFELDAEKEALLTQYLSERRLESRNFPEHEKIVEIRIRIGTGADEVSVIGSDLSFEYISENAEYRS